MEELSSLDYLAPSQSSKFDVVDLTEESNNENQIFQKFRPNQKIQIGKLNFNIILREENDILWEEEDLYSYFTDNAYKICRENLNKNYITKNYENKANLIIYCTYHEPSIYQELGVDVLLGFFLADYTKVKAHIIATCFTKSNVPKGGLLLWCMGLSVLKNLGYKDSYTEAVNGKLVRYYDKLGYKIGRSICGNKDKLIEMYEKGSTLDEIMAAAEDDMLESEYLMGWPMKWCDYDETKICKEAMNQIRKTKNIKLE